MRHNMASSYVVLGSVEPQHQFASQAPRGSKRLRTTWPPRPAALVNIGSFQSLCFKTLWALLSVLTQTLKFIRAAANRSEVSLDRSLFKTGPEQTAGSFCLVWTKRCHLTCRRRSINTLLDTYQLSPAALRAKGSLRCTRIKHEPRPEIHIHYLGMHAFHLQHGGTAAALIFRPGCCLVKRETRFSSPRV